VQRKPRRRAGGREQASARLAAADDFLRGSQIAHDEGLWRSATSNAVLAAIAAGDVAGYCVVGERSASADHRAALAILSESGANRDVRQAFRWLLDQKGATQYLEDSVVDAGIAGTAIEYAADLVAHAHAMFEAADTSGWPRSSTPTSDLMSRLASDEH
jgi:5-enolpyruvylshikimate-3-phosphate synthase